MKVMLAWWDWLSRWWQHYYWSIGDSKCPMCAAVDKPGVF